MQSLAARLLHAEEIAYIVQHHRPHLPQLIHTLAQLITHDQKVSIFVGKQFNHSSTAIGCLSVRL